MEPRLPTTDLWRIGYALKKQWKILKQADLLPVRWGDVDSDAEDYMTITMTNEFEVFRLCDAGWKTPAVHHEDILLLVPLSSSRQDCSKERETEAIRQQLYQRRQ